MRDVVIALLVAFMSLSAFAETAVDGESEADVEAGYEASDELIELLEMLDDDDNPIITEEQRAYFEALPDRGKELLDEAIEYEVMTEADHLGVLLDLDLRAPDFELLMEDFCIVCHADPWQDFRAVFSADPEASGTPVHLNLKEFTADVHFRRGISCAGCHGGDPGDVVMTPPTYQSMEKAPMRHEDRSWVPEFCARCHSDPNYMRRFNPNLPTDQYAKYRESHHGKLLLGEADQKAAQCVSCHTSHAIRSARSPRSTVNAKNVPATCGTCHADADYMSGYTGSDGAPLPTDQLEQYRASVHGRALLELGDLGAPACNDCHGNHAAMPPEIASVSQVCRTCHSGNGELFDGSGHKDAFEYNGWSECAHCHESHDTPNADDSMLNEATNTLCYECHREYAKEKPECEESAKYFHTSITAMARDRQELAEQIEHLAERGLDVDPLSANVEELSDILRQARSSIHAFNKNEFETVAIGGLKAIDVGKNLVEQAEADYRFRRNGLFAAVAIMSLLAVLLVFKIREIDARD